MEINVQVHAQAERDMLPVLPGTVSEMLDYDDALVMWALRIGQAEAEAQERQVLA